MKLTTTIVSIFFWEYLKLASPSWLTQHPFWRVSFRITNWRLCWYSQSMGAASTSSAATLLLWSPPWARPRQHHLRKHDMGVLVMRWNLKLMLRCYHHISSGGRVGRHSPAGVHVQMDQPLPKVAEWSTFGLQVYIGADTRHNISKLNNHNWRYCVLIIRDDVCRQLGESKSSNIMSSKYIDEQINLELQHASKYTARLVAPAGA